MVLQEGGGGKQPRAFPSFSQGGPRSSAHISLSGLGTGPPACTGPRTLILCAPRKKGCGLRSSEHMVLPVWGLCSSTRQSEHQGCAGCCQDGLAVCVLSLALSRAAHSDCCSRQARPTMNAFGLLTLHVN